MIATDSKSLVRFHYCNLFSKHDILICNNILLFTNVLIMLNSVKHVPTMPSFIPVCFCYPQALLGTVCWGFVFGIVSAFSPNYYSLLLLRGLVGFGFGGAFIA